MTDRDNGTTVTFHVGDDLKAILAGTYWTIHKSPKPALLRTDGKQVTTPQLKGCVPGGHCTGGSLVSNADVACRSGLSLCVSF